VVVAGWLPASSGVAGIAGGAKAASMRIILLVARNAVLGSAHEDMIAMAILAGYIDMFAI
jgi:hypothetical protein